MSEQEKKYTAFCILLKAADPHIEISLPEVDPEVIERAEEYVFDLPIKDRRTLYACADLFEMVEKFAKEIVYTED